MEKKKRNGYKVFFLVENILLAAVLLALLISEGSIWYRTHMKRYGNIHRYPTKLTYLAGVDTELDLSGGEVCFSRGTEFGSGVFCASDPTRTDGKKGRCKHILPMEETEVSTNADFNMPGSYYVEVHYKGVTCYCPIVVIDPKDAVN